MLLLNELIKSQTHYNNELEKKNAKKKNLMDEITDLKE